MSDFQCKSCNLVLEDREKIHIGYAARVVFRDLFLAKLMEDLIKAEGDPVAFAAVKHAAQVKIDIIRNDSEELRKEAIKRDFLEVLEMIKAKP